MSRVKLSDPVASLQGKISQKGETIFRCKQYRDERGNVIATGPQEAYVVANPRDRKKNPPTPAEQRHIDLFAEASRRTTIEIASDSSRRAYWEQRFQAQLMHPEHINPDDPTSPRRKTYHQLNTFVRTTIYNELKKKTGDISVWIEIYLSANTPPKKNACITEIK